MPTNEAKQWWDPRDWGKTEEEIKYNHQKNHVEKNKIDSSQKQIINPDSHQDMIDKQQQVKGDYSLDPDAKGFGSGVNDLRYPQEIYSPTMPNAVKFYINARQNSVVAEAEALAAEGNEQMMADLIAANQEYSKEYTKENRAKAEAYETAAASTAALAAALGTASLVGGGKILKDASKLGKVLVTAGSAAVGAVVAKLLTSNTSTMRLLKTITMHVPQSIVSAYQANWDETSLGIAGLIGSGRMDFKDLKELPEFAGRGAITAAANVPKALGADADFGATLEATSKKVNNPYKEQLFKSMGFRKFSFSYTFAPRNIGEANMVMEIIDTFKYHMHPEASQGDMFLIYPAEFSIVFEHSPNGEDPVTNPHLPKISSCALTGCKVTYGPDGIFNTFIDTQGMPTEISMELAFTELETLTAVRIAQGF